MLFGLELLRNLLRDLALDCKRVVQIAIILLGPDMRVGPRVDQLGVQMNPGPVLRTLPSSTSETRSASPISTNIPRAAIFHHARAADHLEIGNFRQLGQNIVLDAIGKKSVLFVRRSDFQREHGDSGSTGRWAGSFFQNDDAHNR